MTATLDDELADLRRANAELHQRLDNALAERDETLAQKAAMAEVLEVINSSPGDLGAVFDAMLEKALALCSAAFGVLWTYDGERVQATALRGTTPKFREFLTRSQHLVGSDNAHGRLLRGEPVVHIADVAMDRAFQSGDPVRRALVEEGGRTLLAVPLRTDKAFLGDFVLYRQEVRPFTDKQIALLQNFAAQAVIAMENARLITETREALEQQTATAEVLQVINSSPGNLAPVFDAILDKAHLLCDASRGTLFLFDGEMFRAAASQGYPGGPPERMRRGIAASEDPRLAALLAGEPLIHVPDLRQLDDPIARAVAERGGVRTNLLLPLRKDGQLLGVLSCNRTAVRPFSDKQIALLQNFAAQAVVAMENARLITETREALEQQTATSEVLQVINSSPGDLEPVFEAMLEKAMRLCDAALGVLWTYDGDAFHVAANRSAPPAYAEFLAGGPRRPSPETAHGRLLRGSLFEHIPDVAASEDYRLGDPFPRALVDLAGGRTILAVPLRQEDMFLGDIFIYRQEVRSFTEKQIALLQNFAAQAVIAMENARLLGELQQRTSDFQESLEYQTAISDVLRVISGSAFDLEPVLETVVATAVRLCRADEAMIYRLLDGEYRWAAGHSLAPEYENIERNVRIRPGPGTLVGRAALERRTVQILDAWTDPLYEAKADARLGGVHTMLGVPLLRDGLPIGVIGLARRRIEPYTEKQIELVTTFADQAVIAIENARLLSELQHRTDELAQRQAELRVTFENMGDGVAMFDEVLRLAAWNRHFQQILDLPDEFFAQPPTYAEYIRYLADRGEFGAGADPEAELRRLTENAGRHYSFERTRPDGRVIEVRHNLVPSGGFVLIYADITERKRSEAEIRAARDAAEHASRTIDAAYRELKAAQANLIQAEKMASLGQLTAGIAHEIKNPLNFVNNFADLSVELLDELKEAAAPAVAALDDNKRAEVDEVIEMLIGNLGKIAEHGRRADGIVKSMLEHSRGSSGERRTVDLNHLVDEALNLAYHGARAQDQTFNVTLERDFASSLPPIELVPQDITRVCLNLFSNGFYAATKREKRGGGPTFEPTLKLTTRDLGDAVEIRVRDNGTGIPAEIKDKLFQPFFTTKPTGEGTGLGLSISYDIVTQQHGSTIEVDSRANGFTEFTIRLPHTPRTTQAQAAS
jgi:GAF domain-containing protein/nitrogen-specific signal transduction histidine kinase